jgi:hypothetical protein
MSAYSAARIDPMLGHIIDEMTIQRFGLRSRRLSVRRNP